MTNTTEAGLEVARPLTCTECGMLCDVREFHPFGACLMFKACRNSETVRANLEAIRECGRAGDAGMVLVPREPTAHMAMAFNAGERYGFRTFGDRYASMLRAAPCATLASAWNPIETAPKNPIRRVLLRWVSGGSEWVRIGSWTTVEESPRLKRTDCPREGWTPDGAVCIPRNQKDCVGWMPLPASPIAAAPAGEVVK